MHSADIISTRTDNRVVSDHPRVASGSQTVDRTRHSGSLGRRMDRHDGPWRHADRCRLSLPSLAPCSTQVHIQGPHSFTDIMLLRLCHHCYHFLSLWASVLPAYFPQITLVRPIPPQVFQSRTFRDYYYYHGCRNRSDAITKLLQGHCIQGSHSFTDKKSRTFQDLMKNFPGPLRSPRMFKYKEKTTFTYNIQSVVHCRKFSMKQNVI